MALPDYLEVLDGGTSGANLIDHVADRDAVIVIDAAAGGDAPGTITWCDADELLDAVGTPLSLHEFGLLETLRMARALGCAPRQTLVLGVQPAQIGLGLGLSETVECLIPQVVEIVLAAAARIAVAPPPAPPLP
jgi:hydrogenase maturation protease